jgi:hypothetical protein
MRRRLIALLAALTTAGCSKITQENVLKIRWIGTGD